MKKIIMLATSVVLLFCIGFVDLIPQTEDNEILNNPVVGGLIAMAAGTTSSPKADGRTYIVVGFESEHADFGPFTPGTKTAGIQEALNACVDKKMDLFITGGYGGQRVYHISDTIHIPPAQDFRIDGGVYVINWTGPGNIDAVWIDSSMNCEYHFGIVVYGGKQAAIRVRPENPVPIDGFAVTVETLIFSQGIADPAPFTAGKRDGGTALVIDGTKAAVMCNKFYFLGGVLNYASCVETIGPVIYNRLEFINLHTNAHESSLMIADSKFDYNNLLLNIGVEQGADKVSGLQIDGSYNDIIIQSRYSGFAEGKTLVFGANAQYNQVKLSNQSAETATASMKSITDLSPGNNSVAFDQLLPARELYDFVDGMLTYTQRYVPSQLIISNGTDVKIGFMRNDTMLEMPYNGNLVLPMSPGDTVVITAKTAPTVICVPGR